jgi:hypothetical protein
MGSTQRNLQAHLNTLKKLWEHQTNESERTLPHGQYIKSYKEPKTRLGVTRRNLPWGP